MYRRSNCQHNMTFWEHQLLMLKRSLSLWQLWYRWNILKPFWEQQFLPQFMKLPEWHVWRFKNVYYRCIEQYPFDVMRISEINFLNLSINVIVVLSIGCYVDFLRRLIRNSTDDGPWTAVIRVIEYLVPPFKLFT